MSRARVLREFWEFLRLQKKYWLAPIVLVLALLGLLLVFAQTSAGAFMAAPTPDDLRLFMPYPVLAGALCVLAELDGVPVAAGRLLVHAGVAEIGGGGTLASARQRGIQGALIAQRLHLSPKTVTHHVSAVLGKLAVPTRRAAAALARQHPDLLPK